jgi:hypothetical protein
MVCSAVSENGNLIFIEHSFSLLLTYIGFASLILNVKTDLVPFINFGIFEGLKVPCSCRNV